MAFLNHPFLGRISGKLGNLVLYQLNGHTIVRERPQRKKDYQPTALQALYQQKFKKANDILRPLSKQLDIGYGELTTATRKGFHLALSQTLKSAMIQTDEGPKVNIEAILISTGFIAPVQSLQAERLEGQKLRLHWTSQGNEGNARESDQSWIVLYQPDQGIVEEFSKPAFRGSQTHLIEPSSRVDLSGAFLFLSFYRDLPRGKRRFSDSVCINLGSIPG